LALFITSILPWLTLLFGLSDLEPEPRRAPLPARDRREAAVRPTPRRRRDSPLLASIHTAPSADSARASSSPPPELASDTMKRTAALPDEVFVMQTSNDSLARLRQLRTPWRDSPVPGNRPFASPLYLRDPANVKQEIEMAPDGKGFYLYERVGGRDVKAPTYLTREEYSERVREQRQSDYFRKKSASSAKSGTANRMVPLLNVNSGLFKDIFGSGKVDIRPNVTALIDLSARTNEQQNPSLNLRQQSNTFFDFRQQLQMNVVGTIGERLRIRANYDTEASFNFENQFKVEYMGQDDDIIKRLEAGNVSLPLNGSLITGGQNLWGVKLAMQLGPVLMTTVASQQRGRTNEIVVRNGAQQNEFTKKVTEYDENRHFFLNHYFRSVYEQALLRPPLVNSNIKVTRIEVYITNRSSATTQNNRNAVGLVDLAETDTLHGGSLYNGTDVQISPGLAGQRPANGANNLYSFVTGVTDARNRNTVVRALEGSAKTLANGRDFELVENMRRLNENEFTLNSVLGYISLNQKLNPNDVLFVAYEYTLVSAPGEVFRVGEFSNDVPSDATNNNLLYLKMLKPSANRPVTLPANSATGEVRYPAWDLMMKNIYSLSAFNIQPQGFRLDVVYQATNGDGNINYLPTSQVSLAQKPLIQVLSLDRLSNNNESGADNRFDFISGVTILPEKGFIIFPVLEPFGKTITDQLISPAEKTLYGYPQLYRLTQVDALQLHPSQNRFLIKGTYANASGQEIQLNAPQIVPGSVRVTANGAPLLEGSDYTVDYQVGKVNLLSSGLRSTGAEIRINFESNTLFGIDQKTLIGTRLDYKVSRNLQLGGTLLYLNERPLINKIVIGEEPMANLLWGLDANWNTTSQAITRGLDRLPFYSTKAPSEVALRAEFAQLRPGFPSQISTGTERGIAYIDDFEGTSTFLDLGSQVQSWVLASTPRDFFEPGTDSLRYGFRRARLSWYQIDARFFDRPQDFGLNNQSPTLNNTYSRRVSVPELFPNRTIAGTDFLQTFDLQYLPDQRGPYNYVTDPTRVRPNGRLFDPKQNWGGIMRRTTGNTDFEAANFEFVEFWMMDPFLQNPTAAGGDLYLNLGKISEDVLPDGRRAYENGLPTTQAEDDAGASLTTTPWGRVSNRQVPTNAFDNNPEARRFQDVGYDGLSSARERDFFASYITAVSATVTDPTERARLLNDPSSDDFVFFGDEVAYPSGTDILTRYRNYTDVEGNTPIANSGDNFSRAQTLVPNVEDINQDGSLSTNEEYYEYKVSITPTGLQVGQNNVIDRRDATVKLPNGQDSSVRWYQFRIPIRSGTAKFGIKNFKAIDFVRLYLTQFAEPTVMRLANFRIVSTSWRSLPQTLRVDSIPPTTSSTFDLATLSVEENSSKTPYPYVVPPEIQRQGVPASPIPNQLQNEQSLQLRIQNLQDGESRAAYKNLTLDLRFYERLKMWVHAEGIGTSATANFTNKGDATVFLRLGSDFDDNYYEVEIPLSTSPLGDNGAGAIWPASNQFDFAIEDLSRAKTQRNVLGRSSADRYAFVNSSGHVVAVRGNPQLNNVRTITIGLRNPKAGSLGANSTDNGQPISVELWANELRVTNFDQSSGWAATGRVNIKLADLGSLSLSGAYSTPGFGGVERRIFERTLEYRKQYDIATTLSLGKLLPAKLGLEIPVYATFGERVITPKWNPYDPDVLLASQLDITPAAKRFSAEASSVDYTRTYSYAFNNVRRVRQNAAKKAQLWDIENFSFSYAFSETYQRSAQIERRLQQQYRGGITYSHTFNVKSFEPFKKWFGGKQNLITAINLAPLPQSVGVTLQGERYYEEEQLRETGGVFGTTKFALPAYYFQDFQLSRGYTLRWDLTRSLGLNYTSNVRSRVDEPRGQLDTPEKRDTLWQRFFKGGRTLNFTQNIAGTYRLPFDKVKPINWISSSLGYTADYRWQAAAVQNQSIGNTIGNGQNITSQAGLNLGNFYRKFPAIARLLKPVPRKTIYSLRDSTREAGDYWRVAGKNAYKALANIVFSIQNIDVNYSTNATTSLPGFLPTPSYLGNAYDVSGPGGLSSTAPGWDFILGMQPNLSSSAWLGRARDRGWLSRDTSAIQPFGQTRGYQLNARTSVSFFKGFRVDLSVQQSRNETTSGIYSFNNQLNDFQLSNVIGSGSFTSSYMGIGTIFGNSDALFEEFNGLNRQVISSRFRFSNPGYLSTLPAGSAERLGNGFYNGYTGNSQDVLIPAFLATYGPNSVQGVGLSPFPKTPLPNWNVTYNGLSDVWFLKEIFKSVTITHGYRSTYTANYLYNLRANDVNGDGFADTYLRADSASGDTSVINFQPGYVIQQVLITESLSPLLGITLAFHNGITAMVDYKRSRQVLLNVGALQLIETKNTEFTLNLAWTRQKFSAPIRIFGSFIELKNQLTARFEITVRETNTRNRRIDSALPSEPTAGNLGYTVKPSVDYNVSTQLTARAYYELSVNKPVLSTAYPTRYTAWGIQIRFTIQ
jgi:cell surface protein SprA